MNLTRRVARPMLAAIFVGSGIDSLRDPKPRVEKARVVTSKLADAAGLPDNPEQLVKVNAGVQVAAGLLLAIGRLPRVAALALAGSIVPTTLAGHRFWEETEPSTRAQQRIHFLKNLGILGGLLLAAVDTAGKPSLSWRAERAVKKTRKTAKRTQKVAGAAIKHSPIHVAS
jgi:putative oxidoreductase